MRARLIAALAVSICCCSRVVTTAETITIAFRDGRVDLSARGVSAREILSAWARIGGVHIVNDDAIPDAPLTLELVDVAEGDALDVVLRAAAGYVAAEREAAIPGRSTIDRIIILPTSKAVATSATASTSDAVHESRKPDAPRNPTAADEDVDAILGHLGIPRDLVASPEGTDAAARRRRDQQH